jgi:hypothetical protein
MNQATCALSKELKGQSQDKEELAIAKKTLQLMVDEESGRRH